MEVLISDLKYFLSLPHHEFWSVMVHVKEIPQDILYSFRIKAPRFYDPTYLIYETHELIWPIYKTIYVLVFRIYMRLATFKESPVSASLFLIREFEFCLFPESVWE
jgi:hypothetical protein